MLVEARTSVCRSSFSCDVVVELAPNTRGMMQSVSSGYKPSRSSIHNDSTAPNGYKRADRIQFGKSIIYSLLSASVLLLLPRTERPTLASDNVVRVESKSS